MKRFRPDMDKVALFNYVFPDSRYEILGYGEIDGKFVRFLRQPIVDFSESTPLSAEERVAYMESLDFKPMNEEKTAFTNGQIVASDIQGNNIVRDRDGNICVIDADMRLHTKDVGGEYSYPPVERDTEATQGIREHRAYHGSGADFSEFDHSHVRFFRTPDGEAYGFSVDGKIYIDPRIARADTPIHEYAHLWATALRGGNAREWRNVVKLMRGTPVWDEVRKLYQELSDDDAIADEVIAQYSGRRGAERLRGQMRAATEKERGLTAKAAVVKAFDDVRAALDKFWHGVADFLHIHYTTAEEVADRVLRDLLHEVNPTEVMDGGKSLRPDTQIIVVEGKAEHGFKNYGEARTWAKAHIARTYDKEETGGKGSVRISNTAIDKFLSQSAVDKSDSREAHLSVLKVLPDVIRESVDAEQHADYKKGKDGVRSEKNGINPNVAIHRLYGAVRIGGKLYRVKITLKEDRSHGTTTNAYSYEATKIELLAGQHGNAVAFPRNSNNSITAANLLNGVEKSYGAGKFFENQGDNSRYSLSEKDKKTLAGVHNISEEKLRKAMKLGGLANPSVAVIDTEKQNHTGYGEVSLILPSEMVAKRTGRNAGTFFGDAWTPTYPQVERIFGKGGSDMAIADIASVPEPMQRMTRNAIDSWMDGREADDLAYLFLQEKGMAPGLVKVKGKYDSTIRGEVSSLSRGKSFYQMSDSEKRKVVDLYVRYRFDGNNAAFEKSTSEEAARLKELQKKYTNPNSLLARSVKEKLGTIEEFGYNTDRISDFLYDVRRDAKAAGEVSDIGTMQEAREIIKKENLQKDFERWKDGLAERYATKEVIFDGFTPSGNRRYVPNDLAHVSKLMKKQGLNGASGQAFTFNNFVATVMEKTGKLSELNQRKGLLTDKKEDLDAFTDKWGKVFNELAEALNPNSKELLNDVGYYRLADVALNPNPKEYAKKEYGVDLTDEDVERIHSLVNAIRNERPAMYFETKFERPVTLNEFTAAVVPKNLGEDVRESLENAGLKLYEYDPQKEGDRKRSMNEAVNSNPDIRFQKKPAVGGNSGYVGYSMSRRAAEAREDGRYPKTDFRKEYGVPDKSLSALVKAGIVDDGEWHHTSRFGNKTTFYGWRESGYADIYSEHKAEIDRMVKDSTKAKMENPYPIERRSAEYLEAMRAEDRTFGDELRAIERKYGYSRRYGYPEDAREKALAEEKTDEEAHHAREAEIRRRYPEDARKDDDERMHYEWEANSRRQQEARDEQLAERLQKFFEEKSKENELEAVNAKFNERLAELTANPKQKDKVLHLGRASQFLKDGGMADAEVVLEYDRLIRKSGEDYRNRHPFTAEDLHDLPKALASPIAVFNGSQPNDHVILTELQKGGKNFIVAVRAVEQTRKGGVLLTVNEITSLYPKEVRGIVNWINSGRISNVDKEKALRFIEALQPHAGTTIKAEELSSSAKVVESFENPKTEAQNNSSIPRLFHLRFLRSLKNVVIL